MDVTDELMQLERRLADEGGQAYDEILAPDALVVVPGTVLDKRACIEAIDGSPRWDRTELTAPRAVAREHCATLVYDFEGWRGDQHYRAVLASTYVRDATRWHLVHHQQTPRTE